MRKKIIEMLSKSEDYSIEEIAISPFELQKADEVFITNAIVGIQPVTKYKKNTFIRWSPVVVFYSFNKGSLKTTLIVPLNPDTIDWLIDWFLYRYYWR